MANVVVVVLDDVGTDKIGAYGGYPEPPATPNLDALAADGLLFRNAWASPSCTPTRTALVTGQHPAAWGAWLWADPDDPWSLPPSAYTVPDLLADAPGPVWDQAFAGKWHLIGLANPAAPTHPLDHGWRWYAGALGNLNHFDDDGRTQPGNYVDWQKDDNGVVSWTNKYATTDTVDDAIGRLAVLEPPWVLWVALNAAHQPWTSPPPELAGAAADSSNAAQYAAVVEAMDHELGRLFAAVPADATVIVIGDNGTTPLAIEPPNDPTHGKNTLFEGGINVPLIVAGSLVDRPGESTALVQAVDVFATLGDIAGVDPAVLPGDVAGRSLLPLFAEPSGPGSEYLFASRAAANGSNPSGQCHAVRDARYKLIRCGGDALFDLRGGGDDGPDLLAGTPTEDEQRAYDRLEGVLKDWLLSL